MNDIGFYLFLITAALALLVIATAAAARALERIASNLESRSMNSEPCNTNPEARNY
jgi:hypothetical protein